MAITNFQVADNTTTAALTASGDTAITAMYITNKTVSDGTVNIYVVPNGDTVSADYKIYNNLLIRAEDTYIIDSEKLILENGDKIYIEADATLKFNATISTIGL